ncbi:hypothetical protein WKH56_09430 [Priestia sp. SB1]|uniref:hypothetical protein n=1 Tax=Priestia sp. SB1 TaxID=3132359 RepID=UPI00316D00A1
MKKIVLKFFVFSAVVLLVNIAINLFFLDKPNWYTAISTSFSVSLGLVIIEYFLRGNDEKNV